MFFWLLLVITSFTSAKETQFLPQTACTQVFSDGDCWTNGSPVNGDRAIIMACDGGMNSLQLTSSLSLDTLVLGSGSCHLTIELLADTVLTVTSSFEWQGGVITSSSNGHITSLDATNLYFTSANSFSIDLLFTNKGTMTLIPESSLFRDLSITKLFTNEGEIIVTADLKVSIQASLVHNQGQIVSHGHSLYLQGVSNTYGQGNLLVESGLCRIYFSLNTIFSGEVVVEDSAVLEVYDDASFSSNSRVSGDGRLVIGTSADIVFGGSLDVLVIWARDNSKLFLSSTCTVSDFLFHHGGENSLVEFDPTVVSSLDSFTLSGNNGRFIINADNDFSSITTSITVSASFPNQFVEFKLLEDTISLSLDTVRLRTQSQLIVSGTNQPVLIKNFEIGHECEMPTFFTTSSLAITLELNWKSGIINTDLFIAETATAYFENTCSDYEFPFNKQLMINGTLHLRPGTPFYFSPSSKFIIHGNLISHLGSSVTIDGYFLHSISSFESVTFTFGPDAVLDLPISNELYCINHCHLTFDAQPVDYDRITIEASSSITFNGDCWDSNDKIFSDFVLLHSSVLFNTSSDIFLTNLTFIGSSLDSTTAVTFLHDFDFHSGTFGSRDYHDFHVIIPENVSVSLVSSGSKFFRSNLKLFNHGAFRVCQSSHFLMDFNSSIHNYGSIEHGCTLSGELITPLVGFVYRRWSIVNMTAPAIFNDGIIRKLNGTSAINTQIALYQSNVGVLDLGPTPSSSTAFSQHFSPMDLSGDVFILLGK
ncbi:hypothetical protein GEMRC1_001732 [Eukaryota sp. GEM-RC1]